jgi:hypothetical protein
MHKDSPTHFDICEKLQELLKESCKKAARKLQMLQRKLQMLQSCFEHFQEAAAKAAGCLPQCN